MSLSHLFALQRSAFVLLLIADVLLPHAASAANFANAAPLAAARQNHTSTLLTSGKLLVVGGTSDAAQSVELYDPLTNSWSPGNALDTRQWHTATLLLSGKVLVHGGFNNNAYLNTTQVYDPATGNWASAAATGTAREGNTATLLASGKVLIAGGYNGAFLQSAEIYSPVTGNWSAAGSMANARNAFTATLLPSGKVLVVGGSGISTNYLASAELYDPTANTWSPAGSLATGRQEHSASLLPSGLVLIAGGRNAAGALATAELYDPGTNSWSAAASMATAHDGHSATLLPSGKVLVTGGYNGIFIQSAELYDATSNSWSAAPSLVTARRTHTATLLANGRVLIAAGINAAALSSAELYDPIEGTVDAKAADASVRVDFTLTVLLSGKALMVGGTAPGGRDGPAATNLARQFDPISGSWSAVASSLGPRSNHTATLLPSGRLLLAGGSNGSADLATAELYDPVANQWSSAAPMAHTHMGHTANLLASGKVLISGGATPELYDPATNSWSAAGVPVLPRSGQTATTLRDGRVLVVGGITTPASRTAEIYNPASNSWSTTGAPAFNRTQHQSTLLFNGQVLTDGGVGVPGTPTSAEIYDPGSGTWHTVASMASWRDQHTATLLPSGKVLSAAGHINGDFTASTEIYDPITNQWNPSANLGIARGGQRAVLLSDGTTLLCSGENLTASQAWCDRFDSGLAPDAARRPALSGVNAFLLQSTALVATGSGMHPNVESAMSGFNSSATNMPVFEVQRMDNDQVLFIASGASDFSDTAFTGEVNALLNFPAGPVSIRTWVNGIPSNARYSTLAVAPGALPATPSAIGGILQATVNFARTDEGGATTTYTATAAPGGAIASCTAPCTSILFSTLPIGTYTFTVRASSAAGNGPISAASNAVVVQNPSTTTLTSSINPSVFGQPAIFTAVITAVSPSGNVTFNDGATALCTTVALSANTATCSTSALAVGPHTITAVYSGSATVAGSTSNSLAQLVNPSTTTLLTSAQNPSSYADGVALTAHVVGQSPTGSVNFYEGASVLCNGVSLDGAGNASCLSYLVPGTHTLTALYNGDVQNAASISVAYNQVVARTPSSVAVVGSPASIVYGLSVVFTASINGGGPNMLDGGVDFSVDGTTICANALLIGQSTSCTASGLSAGLRTVVASYHGGVLYDGPTSAPYTYLVTPDTTSAALSTNCMSVFVERQPLTLNASIAATSSSAVATGTVTFYRSATTALCSNVPLSGGVASCTTNSLAVAGTDVLDSYDLNVSYSGDINHLSSTSSPLGVTVLSAAEVIFRNEFEAESLLCPMQ